MKDTIMIGIVGEDDDVLDMLHLGLKEFPCNEILLVAEKRFEAKAKKIAQKLVTKTRILPIGNSTSLEDVFTTMKYIKEEHKDSPCIINVETDYMSSCLALSSAFVNGMQAIGVMGDKVIAYPIMKFSYYNALTDKKQPILEKLYAAKDWMIAEDIGKKCKMSAPLLSYHMHGNLKSEGLVSMGLIETQVKKPHTYLRLTTLGNLLVRGLVPYDCPVR